jgi:hypothetical protein
MTYEYKWRRAHEDLMIRLETPREGAWQGEQNGLTITRRDSAETGDGEEIT